MCGIFGYIGVNPRPAGSLVEGLRRLEYRGYDSAGAVLMGADGETVFKKSNGRVAALESKLPKDFKAVSGVFHTRWATHGEPSEVNAHPHADCEDKIFVVHNGIIENYKLLKEGLKKAGHKFLSSTDTEVIPHLIEEVRKRNTGLDFKEAVVRALKLVTGSYALVVLDKNENRLVAAKCSSPLILGVGEKEYFIASDASAILPFTRDIVYLNDGDCAVVSRDGYDIFTPDLKSVERKSSILDWSVDQASKQGFPHFMLKEIFEEPEAVENALRGRLIVDDGLAKLGGLDSVSERMKDINRIVIAACGTAYYAGLVGEYMIEENAGIPVEVEYASELRYRNPIFNDGTAMILVSQSGETADTLAALKEAKRKGALTLGIVNVVGSTIARETDAGIYNHAGPEIAVASTKALASQISIMALLAMFLGRGRNMSLTHGREIAGELRKIPEKMKEILKSSDQVMETAKKYASYDNFFYLGRKYNYPVALEGALKLKEISYAHAEGMSAGEMKHGPIALIDKNFPTIFVVPQDSAYEKTISNIEEVRARGGKVIAIASFGDEKIKELADDVIYIPKIIEMLSPLLSIVPLHLFAYYMAVLNGRDVDKPRNLAKSVTVE